MSPAPFLEAYRRRHGMTYRELADHIDYDTGNLCRLFQKKHYDLHVSIAYKFARRLGVSIEVLMGWEPAPEDEDETAPLK